MVTLINPKTGQEWQVDNPIHIKRMLDEGYKEKTELKAEPKKKAGKASAE